MKHNHLLNNPKITFVPNYYEQETPYTRNTICANILKNSIYGENVKEEGQPLSLSYSFHPLVNKLGLSKQSVLIKGKPDRLKTEPSNLCSENSRITIMNCSKRQKENIQHYGSNELMDLRRTLFKETKDMIKSKKNKFREKWRLDEVFNICVPVKEEEKYEIIKKICLNDAKLKNKKGIKSDLIMEERNLNVSNSSNNMNEFENMKIRVKNQRSIEKTKRLKIRSNYIKTERKEAERGLEKERNTVKEYKNIKRRFEETEIEPWKVSSNWLEEN